MLFRSIELFEGVAIVDCVFSEKLCCSKAKPEGLLSFEYTNVANEDCVKFCMKENFRYRERMM